LNNRFNELLGVYEVFPISEFYEFTTIKRDNYNPDNDKVTLVERKKDSDDEDNIYQYGVNGDVDDEVPNNNYTLGDTIKKSEFFKFSPSILIKVLIKRF